MIETLTIIIGGFGLLCLLCLLTYRHREISLRNRNHSTWQASGVARAIEQIPTRTLGLERDIERIEANWSAFSANTARVHLKNRERAFVRHLSSARLKRDVPRVVRRALEELALLTREGKDSGDLPEASHQRLVSFLAEEEQSWSQQGHRAPASPESRYGASLAFQEIEHRHYRAVISRAKLAKGHLKRFEVIHLPETEDVCEGTATVEIYEEYLAKLEAALGEAESILRVAVDTEHAMLEEAREDFWTDFLRRHGHVLANALMPKPHDIEVRRRYASEVEFEERFVEPWIEHLGWMSTPQFNVEVTLGSGTRRLRVDQVIEDEHGKFTLIECKRNVKNGPQLEKAMEQAKSYALHLGFSVFLVMAPQGIWVYALERNRPTLVYSCTSLDEIVRRAATIKSCIMEHR